MVNFVKMGDRQGLFSNCVNVGEGLTRVWRDWLADRAKNLRAVGSIEKESDEEHKKRLLWNSVSEDIGLRLRVIQTETPHELVHQSRDEDEDVCYTLQYEGMFLPFFT